MPVIAYSPKYRFEDYLNWDGDWELWDGVAVSMSPSPDFYHQRAVTRILRLVQNQISDNGDCREECEALAESDWHVSEFTVVRPDGMIVCKEPEGRWVKDPPELIIEALSPSTRDKDLTAKRDLYAAHRVGFYLIVDPENETVTVLKLEDDGTYREISTDEEIELHEGCVLKLDQKALFS